MQWERSGCANDSILRPPVHILTSHQHWSLLASALLKSSCAPGCYPEIVLIGGWSLLAAPNLGFFQIYSYVQPVTSWHTKRGKQRPVTSASIKKLNWVSGVYNRDIDFGTTLEWFSVTKLSFWSRPSENHHWPSLSCRNSPCLRTQHNLYFLFHKFNKASKRNPSCGWPEWSQPESQSQLCHSTC